MDGSFGLTATRVRLVLAITLLSLSHHVDHLLRGVTGWPLDDEFNPFTVSLFVYPLIVVALVLSRRGRVGPRFWTVLAGGGALFVLVVHLGPFAGDSVTRIPRQYGSTLAGVAALVVLACLLVALVGHCVYEARMATCPTTPVGAPDSERRFV